MADIVERLNDLRRAMWSAHVAFCITAPEDVKRKLAELSDMAVLRDASNKILRQRKEVGKLREENTLLSAEVEAMDAEMEQLRQKVYESQAIARYFYGMHQAQTLTGDDDCLAIAYPWLSNSGGAGGKCVK